MKRERLEDLERKLKYASPEECAKLVKKIIKNKLK